MVAVVLRARQSWTNQFAIRETFLFGGRPGRNRIHGFSHSGALPHAHAFAQNHNSGGPCECMYRRREILPNVSQECSQDNLLLLSAPVKLLNFAHPLWLDKNSPLRRAWSRALQSKIESSTRGPTNTFQRRAQRFCLGSPRPGWTVQRRLNDRRH